MFLRALLVPFALAVGAVACAPHSTSPEDGGTDDVAMSADALDGGSALDAAPDGPPVVDVPMLDAIPDATPHAYTMTIGPMHLAPAQEGTWCVIRRLGNMGPEYLRRISANLGNHSHHLIFYRATETTEQPDPFPCNGFSGITSLTQFDSPLLIAQQLQAQLTMPDGVGMGLSANQMVRIELHAINIGTTDDDVSATVQLDTVDQTDQLQRADVMFWGNVNINIPPHAVDAQVHFFQHPPAGHIFAMTSHTHQHGTLATINLATNPSLGTSTPNSAAAVDLDPSNPLHVSHSWSDPPLTLFDPPLQVTDPAQGFHLVCHYDNTTSNTVSFGESFNDEMCFMWAYFYPANGTSICAAGYDGTEAVHCVTLR